MTERYLTEAEFREQAEEVLATNDGYFTEEVGAFNVSKAWGAYAADPARWHEGRTSEEEREGWAPAVAMFMDAGPWFDEASNCYRIEVRTDFCGTEQEARDEADRIARLVDGDVTAIFDGDWEELPLDEEVAP